MVTGEVGAISDNGTFRVAVTHTNYPSPICFNVYFRGVRHRYCENLPPQNPNYADLSAMCMTEPSELRIVPIDCGQDEYLPGEWKTTISPPPGATKPTVSVTTDKAFDPVAQRIRNKATVKWEFGAATNGWSVRLDAMPWATADGAQHAGSVLWNVGPTVARIGTKDYYFDSPGGAQQYLIKATAEACSGKTTDDAAAECTPCDGTASDDPVYFNDGNVGVSDGDPLPAIAGVTLARSYNSNEQVVALFGRGWTTLFDRRLIVNADGGESVISVTTETNDVVTFRGTGGSYRQTWPKARHAAGTLQYDAIAGTYTYRAPGSTSLAVFRASDGALTELRDLGSGRAAQLTYDIAGLPLTLTDSWSGVSWNLTIDPTRRVVTSVAVSGRPDLVWTYSYDSARNLQSVLAPGAATWRTYEYQNNRLTESSDASGNLIESHAYDANGYGISSTGPSDEIQSIQYNVASPNPDERLTRVTANNGQVTDYVLRPSGGSWRTVEVRGGCSTCGSGDATLVRDARGRVVRRQDANGYVTVYTFGALTPVDQREHLLSMQSALKPVGCDPETSPTHCRLGVDALGAALLEPTSASVMTNYDYNNPTWPDKVTAVFRPSVLEPGEAVREERLYHSSTGAIANSTTVGWTGTTPVSVSRVTQTTFYDALTAFTPPFDPGGAFQSAWMVLPQPSGMPKSVDGPRSDVQDVASIVYYPIDPTVPALLRGRMAATKNAAGHVTRYEDYDIFGNVLRIIDPNGVVTENTYDALGRLLTNKVKAVAGCNTTIDPLCASDLTTTFTYSPSSGPLLRQEDAGGAVTSYEYDARGRIQTISRGPSVNDLRERVETTYDPLTGKKILERTLAYEGGAWVEKTRQALAYDALSRLQTLTHADGAAVHYTYDPADRVATIRDENHASPITFYDYDPAGRVASVTQTLAGAPNGVIETQYAYDIAGNLTAVTDPNGNVTSYVYDDFGQMLTQQSPVTGTTTYAYDIAGNLTQTVDANGATTVRTYDVSNRVLTAVSTRGLDTETVTWTYDSTTAGAYGLGRPALMEDPSGSTTYAYDRRGLLLHETRIILGSPYVQTYGYDANGNRTSIGYPSGRMVTYGFDHAGRPVTASGTMSGISTSYVTAATYLPFGSQPSLTLGNGTTETRTYNSRYLPLTNTLTVGATTLAQYTYTNDPAGNITGIADGINAAFNRTFGYDDLNRVTTANTGSALWGNGSFAYDRMGNVLSSIVGTTARTFTYQGATPKINTATGLASAMSYDAAGNELKSPAGDPAGMAAAAFYSPRNLLHSQFVREYDRCFEEFGSYCTQPEPVQVWLSNVYDGRGVRVLAMETHNASTVGVDDPGPTVGLYFYTPELTMLNIVARPVGSRGYVPARAADVIWFGSRPIADHDTTAVRYTFTDHLGTPLLQTSASASVVWLAEYEPFGRVYSLRAGTGSFDQPLRFPGQQVAYATSAGEENYNIFRWYRSGWGRYTTPDPIGLGGGMNLYSYASRNPISNIDPWGLVTWTQNAPVYHGEEWLVIQQKCGSWKAHGCTLPFVNMDCKCKCDKGSGKFKASIKLHMNIDVWVRSEDPKAPITQIMYEETKHVKHAQVMFKWAIKSGEQLEGQSFPTWWQCKDACKAYYKNIYDNFASDWVHENNPHPNF